MITKHLWYEKLINKNYKILIKNNNTNYNTNNDYYLIQNIFLSIFE